MLRRIRNQLQHFLNPLHLFCRLCGFGVRPGLARLVSTLYERGVYRFIL
ncbi:MAG: hypothetical protein KKB70_09480 [Proteobacteria bacterium]|nr:hypothetical protein [Pseudomonadota bacterium]